MEPISFPCPACCGCCGLTEDDILYVSGSHTGTLTWNATTERWEGTVAGACTLHVCVWCAPEISGCGAFSVSFDCGDCDGVGPLPSPRTCVEDDLNPPPPCSCDPFTLYAQCLQMTQAGCCNGVDVDMVITL